MTQPDISEEMLEAALRTLPSMGTRISWNEMRAALTAALSVSRPEVQDDHAWAQEQAQIIADLVREGRGIQGSVYAALREACNRTRPAPVGLGEEEIARIIDPDGWINTTGYAPVEKKRADAKRYFARKKAQHILSRLASQPAPAPERVDERAVIERMARERFTQEELDAVYGMTDEICDYIERCRSKLQLDGGIRGGVEEILRRKAIPLLYRRAQDAIRSLKPTGQGDGWRTMESAPRDGAAILTWGCLHNDGGVDMGEQPSIQLSRWDTFGWYSQDLGSHQPTHWMPLPALPSPPQTGEQG